MTRLLDADLVGEPRAAPRPPARAAVLVLGVGNVLMGDEGVGVHLIRQLEREPAPAGVRLLDGGTGGVNLLGDSEDVRAIVLVDATRDGRAAGSLTYLRPERVADLPRGLGAHDFGLKDLFAACALLGRLPEIHLYTVSVDRIEPMTTTLSPPVAAALPVLAAAVRAQARRLAETGT